MGPSVVGPLMVLLCTINVLLIVVVNESTKCQVRHTEVSGHRSGVLDGAPQRGFRQSAGPACGARGEAVLTP